MTPVKIPGLLLSPRQIFEATLSLIGLHDPLYELAVYNPAVVHYKVVERDQDIYVTKVVLQISSAPYKPVW